MIPAQPELKLVIAFVGLIGALVGLWRLGGALIVDGLAVIGGVGVIAFVTLLIVGRVAERRH